MVRRPHFQLRLSVFEHGLMRDPHVAVILVQSLRDSKIELQHQRRVLFNGASSKALTNGPYMLSPVNGETFAVWKLLKDHYSAFIQGAVEMKPQSMGFLWLDIEVNFSKQLMWMITY